MSTAAAAADDGDGRPRSRHGSQEARRQPARGGGSSWACRLQRIYDGRTFRFCFTNQQMADAVTDFVWSRDELRPDGDPAYSLPGTTTPTRRPDDSFSARPWSRGWRRRCLQEWAWRAGCATAGRFRLRLCQNLAARGPRSTASSARPPYAEPRIDSSVGSFSRPNRFEVYAAESLMDDLDENAGQQRPLLLLSGQTQPSRRFLHALRASRPGRPAAFVVASGDAIAFNTVYRDRNVAWPIQDLPFSLVFFCHRNPVDPRGRLPPSEDAELTGRRRQRLARPAPKTCCCTATSWKPWCRRSRKGRAHRPTPTPWASGWQDSICRTAGSASTRTAGTCSTRTATGTAAPASTSSGSGPRSSGAG